MGGFVFNSETLVKNHIIAYNTLDNIHCERLLDTYPLYICPICYPPNSFEATIEFQNFWNWIHHSHAAQAYTKATFEFFEYYRSVTDSTVKFSYLEDLIRSILFEKRPGTFEFIFFEIQAATEDTINWFTQETTSLPEQIQTRVELNLFDYTSEEETQSTTSNSTNSNTPDGMDQNAQAIL